VVDNATLNGALGSLTVTEPAGSGGDVIFTFNGLSAVNSDNDTAHRTVDIYLSARVLDEAGNNGRSSPQLKNNLSSLTWDENTGSPVQSSAPVYVVEPRLVITKSFTPNPVDGGATIRVTLQVRNNGTADAFNVVVTDPLVTAGLDLASITENVTPAGFIFQYVNPVLTYGSDGSANGGRINVGQTRQFRFNAVTRNNIIAGTPYPNTASESYTSLPAGNPPGRSYTASVTANLTARGASAAKSLYSTSEANDISGDPDVVVGEVLTYQLEFDFPRHPTENVTLVDVLPANTAFIAGSALISRNTDNLTATGFVFTAPVGAFETIVPSATSPLSFSIGTVNNTNTDPASRATITMRVNAVAKNVSGVQRGTQLANLGQVQFNAAGGSRITVATNTVNSFVNIPSPFISKTADPAVVEGGQAVTFAVRVQNQSIARSAPMFNINVLDALDSNYHNLHGIVINTAHASDTFTVNNSTSTQLNIDIRRLNPGEYIDITYVADVIPGVAYGSTISNTVLLTATSLPGDHGTGGATPGAPGTETGKRTGSGSGANDLRSQDTRQVRVSTPTMGKDIVNPQARYSIGEIVTHVITASVPAGSTAGVRLSDNLSAGFSFVPGSLVVTLPAGVNSGNAPVEDAPFFTRSRISLNDPELISFDFGNVTALSSSNILISYQARVDDIPANQNGTVLRNDAAMFYIHAGGLEVTAGQGSTSVMVGLPQLTLAKTIVSNTTRLQAGDRVDYQVVITSTGQTTAYNAMFTDNVSTKLTGIFNVLVTSSVSPTPSALVAGNNISMGPFTLPVGESVTLRFSARLAGTVVPGESINNTGRLSYDSSPGPGQRTMPTLLSSAAFNVDSTINVSKGLSSVLPSDRFAIGSTVIYEIKVDIIQGTTPGVSIQDTLPSGLAYQGADVISGNAGITYSNPAYNAPAVAGQTVTFNLGNVTNLGDGNPANNYFKARIFATVMNVAGNHNGVVLNNSARIFYTGGPPAGVLTNDVAVTVVEPRLVTFKDSDLDEVTLGNRCTFTVTVRHSENSTADAYDLKLADTLPAGLTYVDGSCSLPESQIDVSGLPGSIIFNIPVLTLAQGSASFTYKCRVEPNAAAGVDMVNRNVLTYASLSGANVNKRTGADGPGGLNDYYTTAQRTIKPIVRTTIHALKTVIDDDGAPAYGGDTLTYNITLANTGIPASGVVFTDQVPANTAYVPGSLATDRGTVVDIGTPLVVNVGAMNTGDVVRIRFKVVIDPELQGTIVISNQGMLMSEQTSLKLSGPSGDGADSAPTVLPAQPRPKAITTQRSSSSVSTAASGVAPVTQAPPVALPNFAVTKVCVEAQEDFDQVVVCLKNTTAGKQFYTARLVVSGVKKYPKTIALLPGASSCTAWMVPKAEAGSYRVNINELEMVAPACAVPAPSGSDRDALIVIFGSLFILVGVIVIVVIIRLKFK
jgi:uncharacterized repeat protein (TIGR01451 family)/fimbrial isopeptide formation D2 family protein